VATFRERYGATFELTPLGYQFESGVPDHDDLNRLRIQVRVSGPDGSWGGDDFCLLTWELRKLHQWLRLCASAELGTAEPMLDFMEPMLAFEFVGGEPILLRVEIRGGQNTGAMGSGPRDRRVVNLVLSREELLNAANELEVEASRYPER
jgi:hypothetical protein